MSQPIPLDDLEALVTARLELPPDAKSVSELVGILDAEIAARSAALPSNSPPPADVKALARVRELRDRLSAHRARVKKKIVADFD